MSEDAPIEVGPTWPTEPSPQGVRIALVGEAPSDHEVEKGRPFVGPSGQVLDAILRSANIERKELFITNVFNSKLEENDVAKHKAILGPERWGALLSANIARLADELAAANPTVVVALGNTALLALTGKGGIANMRGAPLMGAGPFERYKVLPTLHPAFVMRTWKMYSIVIGDFIKAVREVEKGPTVVYPKRRLLIEPTLKEALAFMERCQKADLLSVDIETGWGQVRGISFAPSAEEAIYVPFIVLNKPSRSYWPTLQEEVQVWKAVKHLLESPVPKLGQNFSAYDAVWLYQKMGIRVMNIAEDTRLLHHALYAELPKSLEFMAAAYSEQGPWKQWGKAGWRQKDRGAKRDE